MDNDKLIVSFMEISNLPTDEAKKLLEDAGYNLELAIQNYYDNMGNSSRNTQSLPNNEISPHMEEEEVRPIIPREYDTLIQNETARDIHLSMIRHQFVSSSFRDLKREMEIQEELARGEVPKRRCLEDIFRHPVDIAFNVDFYQAKHKGQEMGKWVAVLINNESLESLSFNRDIFNEESKRVKSILRKNFIFLRKNSDDFDALRILQIYNLLDCQTIPIFLIIDSVTGELRKNFNDCSKLSLKCILKELKKYTSTDDNQLIYKSSNEDSDEEDSMSINFGINSVLKPSTSKAYKILKPEIKQDSITQINTNKFTKSIESDEESFASINSNDLSNDSFKDEVKIVDSDDETLKKYDGPQTNVLLRLQDENHKFKYPAKRTIANLINYIYRNYLVPTGIYDNRTKRFSLISKIHNKCLTMLDQEKSLEEADIHPSVVLLHNTLDKE